MSWLICCGNVGTVHSELALRHKKSNVISHSSFQHVRVQAVIAAVAATAAGAVALAKIQKGQLLQLQLVRNAQSQLETGTRQLPPQTGFCGLTES